jgi:hypothetical protein
MAKFVGIATLLCLVTGSAPAFAFDEAKCNQHCAVNWKRQFLPDQMRAKMQRGWTW